MRIVVGDETGLLKLVSLEKGQVLASVGDQSRERGVDALCWSGAPDRSGGVESQVAAAHR